MISEVRMAIKETYFNHNRINIGEMAPLGAPLSITVGVSGKCNLKCIFCGVNDPNDHTQIRDMMSFETFKKLIDDAKLFPVKPKKIGFIGNGEPLMNKDIVRMVKYAHDANIFNTIEIITNGVLLTPEMNLALIEAGLTNLSVSLEAIDDETFEKVARVKVNVNQLTETLRHFYEHKKQCNVYIKTVNIALDSEEKVNRFYEIYSPICDHINIETVVDLDGYDQKSTQLVNNVSILEGKGIRQVCTHLFKNLTVYSNGLISACCTHVSPEFTLGNIKTDSIVDVWNGKKLRILQKNNLSGNKLLACRTCNPANVSPHDDIDAYAEAILKRMNDEEDSVKSE